VTFLNTSSAIGDRSAGGAACRPASDTLSRHATSTPQIRENTRIDRVPIYLPTSISVAVDPRVPECQRAVVVVTGAAASDTTRPPTMVMTDAILLIASAGIVR
jgi:hypothetical protein